MTQMKPRTFFDVICVNLRDLRADFSSLKMAQRFLGGRPNQCPYRASSNEYRVSGRVGGRHPSRDVMMIPATMITIAAPRTAIAISPGEYFVFFFAGALCA
jgi:hypothetical protein